MTDDEQRLSRRALLVGVAAAVAGAGGAVALLRGDEPGRLTVRGLDEASEGSTDATSDATSEEPADVADDEPGSASSDEAPPTSEPAEGPGAADGEDPELPGVAAASVALLCRNAWGARSAGDGFEPHDPVRLTLHHTAVVLGDNAAAPSRLRGHQSFHMDQGWPDLAYHYAVDRDGNAYEGRPVDAAGDTFTDYDPAGHFLVVCEGDFSTEAPTEQMLDTVAGLFAWGADWFGIDPDTLSGHRDHASTTCPGDNLYAVIADGSLRARIEDRLGVGVQLEVVCGLDGRAAVAAIEA